jgi:adenosylhomocysteine nucleosidase
MQTCVLFALRREALFFWKHAENSRRLAASPCPAWHCDYSGRPLLVFETGIGSSAMAPLLRWLFEQPGRPERIVSAGFSGALQPGLSIGDLIWAEELVDHEGKHWPTAAAAGVAPGTAKAGRLLTMPELVGAVEQKRLLGEQFRALAVDMETAEIGRLCHDHGVPLACLRVISDDWTTPLSPQLVEVLRHGRVAPVRLLGALLRKPALLGELWNLGRQTHLAARQLAQGLLEVLQTE